MSAVVPLTGGLAGHHRLRPGLLDRRLGHRHGCAQIVAAIRLRQEIDNEWLLGLAGVVSVLFGLYVAVLPGAGALAIVWLIGAYAIVFGILLIALGLRLRSWQHETDTRPTQQPGFQQHPVSRPPR